MSRIIRRRATMAAPLAPSNLHPNLMALARPYVVQTKTTNFRTFSSVCALLISTRGTTIVIVHGNREGYHRGQLRRRWQGAWSRLVRRQGERLALEGWWHGTRQGHGWRSQEATVTGANARCGQARGMKCIPSLAWDSLVGETGSEPWRIGFDRAWLLLISFFAVY